MDDVLQLPGVPIDRGWSWVIVAGSALAVFIMVGMAKSMGILLVEMAIYFAAPKYLVFLVMGVASILYTVCAPISLVLGEAFTQRKVVICGGFIAFIGMSLGSLLFSVEFVIVTFGIGLGIGNGFLYGNVLVMLGTYFRKRRSLANGLALAGASLGTLAMPPLFQVLLDTFHISGTILLMAAIYGHVILCGALFRPLSWYTSRLEKIQRNDEQCHTNQKFVARSDKEPSVVDDLAENESDYRRARCKLVAHSKEELDASNHLEVPKSGEFLGAELGASSLSLENILAADSKPEPKKSILQKLKQMFDFSVLKNHVCQLLLLFCPFAFFGYFNFIIFLPAIVTDEGVQDIHRAWLVSTCGISDFVARVATGAIGDRNLFPRYYILIGAQLIVGVNMIAFAWSHNYWSMVVQCAVYGLSTGAYVSVYNVVVIDFLGLDQMPKALALILLLQGIAASVGQVILGAMRDARGDYFVVLMVLGSSSVIAAAILCFYPLARRWESSRVDGRSKTKSGTDEEELAVMCGESSAGTSDRDA